MVRVRTVLVRVLGLLVLQKMIAVCSTNDGSLLAVALQVEAVLVIVLAF